MSKRDLLNSNAGYSLPWILVMQEELSSLIISKSYLGLFRWWFQIMASSRRSCFSQKDFLRLKRFRPKWFSSTSSLQSSYRNKIIMILVWEQSSLCLSWQEISNEHIQSSKRISCLLGRWETRTSPSFLLQTCHFFQHWSKISSQELKSLRLSMLSSSTKSCNRLRVWSFRRLKNWMPK